MEGKFLKGNMFHSWCCLARTRFFTVLEGFKFAGFYGPFKWLYPCYFFWRNLNQLIWEFHHLWSWMGFASFLLWQLLDSLGLVVKFTLLRSWVDLAILFAVALGELVFRSATFLFFHWDSAITVIFWAFIKVVINIHQVQRGERESPVHWSMVTMVTTKDLMKT